MKDVVPIVRRTRRHREGTLDFRKLLAAIPDVRSKPVYVEQEGPADPMASARQNCQFLAALDF